jgi:MFS family permease
MAFIGTVRMNGANAWVSLIMSPNFFWTDQRTAIFYSSSTLAGAFSGLIAYGIQKNLEIPGERPAWQYLYIIEGSFAILVGLLIFGFLPQFPTKINKSRVFSQEEIDHAKSRCKGD